MSINVVTFCQVHGQNVEIFTIGKRRFCSRCVSNFMAERCGEIKMVTIKNDPKLKKKADWEHHYICPACQHTWKAEEGSACPNCGTDAKDPEPGYAVREFTCKSCGTVWPVPEGKACPKCGRDALETGNG